MKPVDIGLLRRNGASTRHEAELSPLADKIIPVLRVEINRGLLMVAKSSSDAAVREVKTLPDIWSHVCSSATLMLFA